MKRKILIFGLLGLLLFGSPLICMGQQEAPVKKKVDLKVIYVGQPETDRSKSFVKLLSDNFTKVEMLDQAKFEATKTAEFDVVVLDYVRPPRQRGAGATRGARSPGLQLPKDYSKPTVVFGSFGTRTALNWLKPEKSYT